MRAGTWIRYTVWLGIEIVKSNLAVARVLIDPRLPIRALCVPGGRDPAVPPRTRRLRELDHPHPGTVSIDLHGDAIDVHSLLEPDLRALGEMDRRVSAMERSR